MAKNTIDFYYIELKMGPFTKEEYDIRMSELKKIQEEESKKEKLWKISLLK